MSIIKRKFGNEWKNISAWWLATRIKRHLSTKDFFKKKSIFGYLEKTYLDTIKKNENYLKNNKSKINYNYKIKKLNVKSNRITNIITSKNFTISKNEKIISTVPLFVLKNIIDNKKITLKNLKELELLYVL